MANRVPPPPRDFNWVRMLRTLSLWALLIVGTVALVQLASKGRQAEISIVYNPGFLEELASGNIASVEIMKDGVVTGRFKRPVTAERRTADKFTMRLPFDPD